MTPMVYPFPEIPDVTPSVPQGPMIITNANGEIYATKEFDVPLPVWRKYKRLGWALRYIGKRKEDMLVVPSWKA